MAAVAVIAVILVKLIPALRSPLSADPGPEGSVPPAETLVTGETEDIDESEETDESSGNEHEATEDTGPVFETEYFTFTLPEIWRSSPQNELPVSSVDVLVNDNELYVTYRGLTLCVIRAMQLNEVWQAYFEGMDDGRAVLWETNDDDGNTVLLTNPVALSLRDAGSPGWITSDFITSDYATSDTADAFTSDSDIVDILYILTGQEVDLERLRTGDEDADEYIQSVENAVRISFIMNVANQVLVPSCGGSGPNLKDYDPAALKSSCLTELLQAEPYSYEGLPESIEDCQIPEDVLRSLTNEELILTVLDYPYNEEIMLPEGWPMTNQSWGDIRKKTFNGFRELTEREEQSSILQRLNMCHDYIVREYGWEKPRDLLGYLEALIIYLDDSLDENSTIW
ncbi:MAG: hypothetical protein IJL78_09135 [Lachnospiraceae bacterium]|nr:hypothetical protein [Lachnospiraceae bacterium]